MVTVVVIDSIAIRVAMMVITLLTYCDIISLSKPVEFLAYTQLVYTPPSKLAYDVTAYRI